MSTEKVYKIISDFKEDSDCLRDSHDLKYFIKTLIAEIERLKSEAEEMDEVVSQAWEAFMKSHETEEHVKKLLAARGIEEDENFSVIDMIDLIAADVSASEVTVETIPGMSIDPSWEPFTFNTVPEMSPESKSTSLAIIKPKRLFEFTIKNKNKSRNSRDGKA